MQRTRIKNKNVFCVRKARAGSRKAGKNRKMNREKV